MNKYKQSPQVGKATRFAKSPMAEVEFSRMTSTPKWALPFNAGDIVPVYYAEVLPHDTISLDIDYVIRQNTVLRPTMGTMQVDFYAFFVPNRIINDSWKNVMGENTSGYWSAPEVDLAPLYADVVANGLPDVQIPVGSIADYYGFPTQLPIKAEVLQECNDLKFKGYLSCYNNYFRDQNYQPPIPFSTLNVYQGFLSPVGTLNSLAGQSGYTVEVDSDYPADGSFARGALVKSVYGDGFHTFAEDTKLSAPARLTTWSALDKPLKANKLHDAFTSALPSPQKGTEVYFGIGSEADVSLYTQDDTYEVGGIKFAGSNTGGEFRSLGLQSSVGNLVSGDNNPSLTPANLESVYKTNLKGVADLSQATGISVNDLRTAVATQQVYETLARGGSRYTSVLRNFFELDIESPFADIPTKLGHIRKELDLFQVAQTSASDSSSPQGTLTAFGYTTAGGNLFTRTFLEHGYIHVFAVVRHVNVYSTYFAPDNFRKHTLDFYLPQFANIGEQPIPVRTLNPFVSGANDSAIAYQEAWWEYRYEPDRVHGLFRPGVEQSLDVWNYADEFDGTFTHVNGDWLKSNSEEVLNRTLAVTSALAPQFKGLFAYKVDKQRPMPIYSIPGLDTI